MAQATKQNSTRIISREAGGTVLRINFSRDDDDKPFDGAPHCARRRIIPLRSAPTMCTPLRATGRPRNGRS